MAQEVNFDGLVGLTHNYAGLSYGNIASQSNRESVANPKMAALQGLDKMMAVRKLGLTQGLLLPHLRPNLEFLHRLGYQGSDQSVIRRVASENPSLLSNLSSASPMWTANAATVSPSADTTDGRIHFTPANLLNKLHRSIEHLQTGKILQAIFNDARYFAHHPALPAHDYLGDEGAANHTRFCKGYGQPGVEFFVYGKQALNHDAHSPRIYPARQTLEASQAVARLHGLDTNACVFAQQHPDTIDQGVFHNDVIAVGNQNVLLYHQAAFLNSSQVIEELRAKVGPDFVAIEVPESALSVKDAVSSYLFNSQLLGDSGSMSLIVPAECQANPKVSAYLDQLVADQNNPIHQVHVMDLHQSMRNGGGPACLRLRVVLTDEELAHVNGRVILDEQLETELRAWIEKHYRDRLSQQDLSDPQLYLEGLSALDELTQITHLGSVYEFQR